MQLPTGQSATDLEDGLPTLKPGRNHYSQRCGTQTWGMNDKTKTKHSLKTALTETAV